MSDKSIGVVELINLDCKTKYSIRVGLIRRDGTLISPRLILGELNPGCLNNEATVNPQGT